MCSSGCIYRGFNIRVYFTVDLRRDCGGEINACIGWRIRIHKVFCVAQMLSVLSILIVLCSKNSAHYLSCGAWRVARWRVL